MLEPLADLEFDLVKVTLTCSPERLRERLERDVAAGLRGSEVIDRSLERLPLYEGLDTHKIDVGVLSAREATDAIAALWGRA